MGLVAVLVAGAAAAAVLAWPRGAIGASGTGLAAVSLPDFAGHVEGVSVTDPAGKPLAVSLRHGTVWPLEQLAPGERLTVTVDFQRPSWVGWLVGREVRRTYTVIAPLPRPKETLLHPAAGGAVTVRFDSPVSRIAVGGHVRFLSQSRRVVPLGFVASGATSSGAATVAVAARPWESLSQPMRVSWFAPGARVDVVAGPAPGTAVAPTSSLTLTFAKPVASVLGARLPTLDPAVAGSWSRAGANVLEFRPANGLPLGGTVRVSIPGASFTWKVEPGSTLRLQELLARLGYLPVQWRGPAAGTSAAELAAAVAPPTGTFYWRFPHTPEPLRRLWKPGAWNVVTQGAVMAFENAHGLPTDVVAGPAVWRLLFSDDLSGRRHRGGYNYVFVHETIPESMNLWHDGKVILTSPGNTGIPQSPTAPGTWPVFEHIPVGTMSGTNPDGSHYHDPGIQWISYFHGGDALHEFPRASYGTPQSLGCVELPAAAAAKLWPYTPIGTLVTIVP